MLSTALVIFLFGAVGGVVLAMHVLRGKFAPKFLAMGHGLLGVVGILLLIYTLMQSGGGSRTGLILGIFVLAAFGGLYLASFHRKQQLPPKAVVVGHAALAVTGVVILALSVLG